MVLQEHQANVISSAAAKQTAVSVSVIGLVAGLLLLGISYSFFKFHTKKKRASRAHSFDPTADADSNTSACADETRRCFSLTSLFTWKKRPRHTTRLLKVATHAPDDAAAKVTVADTKLRGASETHYLTLLSQLGVYKGTPYPDVVEGKGPRGDAKDQSVIKPATLRRAPRQGRRPRPTTTTAEGRKTEGTQRRQRPRQAPGPPQRHKLQEGEKRNCRASGRHPDRGSEGCDGEGFIDDDEWHTHSIGASCDKDKAREHEKRNSNGLFVGHVQRPLDPFRAKASPLAISTDTSRRDPRPRCDTNVYIKELLEHSSTRTSRAQSYEDLSCVHGESGGRRAHPLSHRDSMDSTFSRGSAEGHSVASRDDEGGSQGNGAISLFRQVKNAFLTSFARRKKRWEKTPDGKALANAHELKTRYRQARQAIISQITEEGSEDERFLESDYTVDVDDDDDDDDDDELEKRQHVQTLQKRIQLQLEKDEAAEQQREKKRLEKAQEVRHKNKSREEKAAKRQPENDAAHAHDGLRVGALKQHAHKDKRSKVRGGAVSADDDAEASEQNVMVAVSDDPTINLDHIKRSHELHPHGTLREASSLSYGTMLVYPQDAVMSIAALSEQASQSGTLKSPTKEEQRQKRRQKHKHKHNLKRQAVQRALEQADLLDTSPSHVPADAPSRHHVPLFHPTTSGEERQRRHAPRPPIAAHQNGEGRKTRRRAPPPPLPPHPGDTAYLPPSPKPAPADQEFEPYTHSARTSDDEQSVHSFFGEAYVGTLRKHRHAQKKAKAHLNLPFPKYGLKDRDDETTDDESCRVASVSGSLQETELPEKEERLRAHDKPTARPYHRTLRREDAAVAFSSDVLSASEQHQHQHQPKQKHSVRDGAKVAELPKGILKRAPQRRPPATLRRVDADSLALLASMSKSKRKVVRIDPETTVIGENGDPSTKQHTFRRRRRKNAPEASEQSQSLCPPSISNPLADSSHRHGVLVLPNDYQLSVSSASTSHTSDITPSHGHRATYRPHQPRRPYGEEEDRDEDSDEDNGDEGVGAWLQGGGKMRGKRLTRAQRYDTLQRAGKMAAHFQQQQKHHHHHHHKQMLGRGDLRALFGVDGSSSNAQSRARESGGRRAVSSDDDDSDVDYEADHKGTRRLRHLQFNCGVAPTSSNQQSLNQKQSQKRHERGQYTLSDGESDMSEEC